jgi:hypothetical protein
MELVYLDLVPWMRAALELLKCEPLIGSPGGYWSFELDPFRMKLMLRMLYTQPFWSCDLAAQYTEQTQSSNERQPGCSEGC